MQRCHEFRVCAASGIPQASFAHSLFDTLWCLQLWLRLGVMAYFLLCMGLLWLVRSGTCAANQFVDTGVMPMHVRLQTAVPALLIIGMPCHAFWKLVTLLRGGTVADFCNRLTALALLLNISSDLALLRCCYCCPHMHMVVYHTSHFSSMVQCSRCRHADVSMQLVVTCKTSTTSAVPLPVLMLKVVCL